MKNLEKPSLISHMIHQTSTCLIMFVAELWHPWPHHGWGDHPQTGRTDLELAEVIGANPHSWMVYFVEHPFLTWMMFFWVAIFWTHWETTMFSSWKHRSASFFGIFNGIPPQKNYKPSSYWSIPDLETSIQIDLMRHGGPLSYASMLPTPPTVGKLLLPWPLSLTKPWFDVGRFVVNS